jgi:hypothetical protein
VLYRHHPDVVTAVGEQVSFADEPWVVTRMSCSDKADAHYLSGPDHGRSIRVAVDDTLPEK